MSLINFGLSLDQISLSFSAGISNGETGGADTLILGLKLPEVFVNFLVLDLSLDLKTLQHAVCFLLKTHGLVLGCGFLGAGLNLEGHINGLLQRETGFLLNWVDGLNVDLGNQKVVRLDKEG